ncbi:MAG: MBL fold metallo-hydrolase [Clostridia bacterium]|nr:MBL fold metallo-hydrolase [Clostridia bacterium]
MKIQFCGAAGSVTGSCFLVTTEKSNFLVDCGLFQGSKELKELNYSSFLFDPNKIDFVLLTHAHIDHCGMIPKLFKKGFSGFVYSTKATRELCSVVLPDSGHIQEMEVERKNRKLSRSGGTLLEPIYTVEDARMCMELFKSYDYDQQFEVVPGIKVKFYDAGHILGSSMIELIVTENQLERTILFTGDVGNVGQAIVEDPTKIKNADIVVMESTYGNRYHMEKEDKLAALARVVKQTMKKGGNLVIPSFAVERTQDLVYYLKNMKEKGEIPAADIYIDSPMAVEATKVFIQNPQCFDEEASIKIKGKGAKELFEGQDIHYIVSAEESIALNKIKSGSIIISASGMADAGRIKHHLKHNLWRSESTVLFVGYQAQGTLGRRILEGERKVKIHGEEIAVKASIEMIDDFSAHADQKGLLEWLKDFEEMPGQIILVHGEEDALDTLQRVIRRELGIQAKIAEYGKVYDLEKEILTIPKIEVSNRITSDVVHEPSMTQAFSVIKDSILQQSKNTNSDNKNLQRLLAQLAEIEREIEN